MRLLGALIALVLALALVDAQLDDVTQFPTSRKLCCFTQANYTNGNTLGLPQFNPLLGVANAGCPAADNVFLNTTATAVAPNNSYVQEIVNFFPYCRPMLDQWNAAGKLIVFPTRPQAFDATWEGVKASLIGTLNSAYSLVRTLGHSGAQPWMDKECLNVLIRSVCHSVFREADVPAAFGGLLVVARPIPLEVVAAFDSTKLLYKSHWEYIINKPEKEFAKQPSCRDALGTFLAGLVAAGATTTRNAALILPYQDDCECGCPSVGSNNLIFAQPRYLRGYQSYDLSRTRIALPITINTTAAVPAVNTSAFLQNGQWPCYFPWVNASDKDPNFYCALRCPSAFRTNFEYKQAEIMMGIIGWLSYISTFFVFATMLCMPRYRHFPANLVLFVLFCSHILAFAFVFTITRGWRKTVCRDHYSPRWGYHEGNGACVFNALTVIFGGLGTTFFWCAVAINSFIAIYLKRDSILRSRWFEIGTHVICWGTPFTCTLIALAAQQIGTPNQLLFCFVTEDPYHPKDGKAFSWQYPLFYGPIGFCIVVATGAIVMVLYEMRNLRAASGSGRFNKHIRIALFLVVFLGIYAFVFAYRFTITTDQNKWRASLTTYARSAFEGTSQVGLSSKPSYGLFMAFNFFIGIQGALVSILFGSNTDVLTFWGERVQNIREGRSFFSGITSYTASSKVGASSVRATGNAE